jgi:hypothetical protein
MQDFFCEGVVCAVHARATHELHARPAGLNCEYMFGVTSRTDDRVLAVSETCRVAVRLEAFCDEAAVCGCRVADQIVYIYYVQRPVEDLKRW